MKNNKLLLVLSTVFSLTLVSGCGLLEGNVPGNGMTPVQLEQWAAENGYIKNPNYQQWAEQNGYVQNPDYEKWAEQNGYIKNPDYEKWAEQNGYVKPQEGGAVLAALPDPWLSTNEFKTRNCSITLNPDQYANNSKPMIDYLNRSDSIYIDLRDAYEGYNVGHVSGFEPISWFRLLCGDNNQLFYVDENKVYHPRYEESEYLLKKIFPEDKNIFIMCQSGGRVMLCLNLLSQYGYDMNKCYNIGGFNSISGNNNTLGYTIISSVKAEQTNYNFDNLTKINNSNPNPNPDSELAGTYDIKLWVPENSVLANLFDEQIDKFEEQNPSIILNASIELVPDWSSASNMIADAESGADIFHFTQSQLSMLVQDGVLSKLESDGAQFVLDNNDDISVKAATYNSNIYAYPFTSDNGYFMYYDKSVIKESSLDSLEAIIADCEAAGRNLSFEIETNSWYNVSWFFGTGCKSEWIIDGSGNFTGVDDNFNSDAGLAAIKGMQKLATSNCHISSSNGSDFNAAIPSAVVVTGTWEANIIKEILGENYGATDLPSFEVDGQSYHLGSFSGNRLFGVKPQLDNKRSAVLHKLAQFLTDSECQLERYEAEGWGPSNKIAQSSDLIKDDIALQALYKQNEYANPQLAVHSSWWEISRTYALVAGLDSPKATEDELKQALQSYEKSIKRIFGLSQDELLAFGLVGSFEGGSWNDDIIMEENPTGTYYTTAPILFETGNEFKIRQGQSWDVNFGQDGQIQGGNYIISNTEAGYRYVKMKILSGSAEDAANATVQISLEKYNPSYSWSVIGTLGETNWDTDFYLTQISKTEFLSDYIAFDSGSKFKIRKGSMWDINYGVDGVLNGADIVVDQEGIYRVKLTIVGETVSIELIPAE